MYYTIFVQNIFNNWIFVTNYFLIDFSTSTDTFVSIVFVLISMPWPFNVSRTASFFNQSAEFMASMDLPLFLSQIGLSGTRKVEISPIQGTMAHKYDSTFQETNAPTK